MLVLLDTRYRTASEKDFDVLERIFRALGVEGGVSAKAKRASSRVSTDFQPARFRFQLNSGRQGPAETEFFVQVSDPLLALRIVKQNGGAIIPGLSDAEIAAAGFRVKLPSGARVQISALPSDPRFSELPALSGGLNAAGKCFAIVVARFNAFITDRLLQGSYDGLVRSGALHTDVTIVRVPGAFEIPLAARTLAETKKYDAILCIGCLLRGDTAHYDVIVNEVTRGIGQAAQETGIPHAFGVLTCDTLEQAIDRAGLKMGNKGFEVAMAAVEMANLRASIGVQSPKLARKFKRKNSPKPASPRRKK